MTLAEASAALAAGRTTSAALTEEMLERIDASKLDTTVTLLADSARAAAREADATPRRGPLHGVPIGLKDCIDVAGVRTTGCSRLLLDNVARTDAEVTRRLRAAGAVIVAKHSLYELNYGGPSFDLPFPPARNPWDPGRIPGGSSSGSAAAVAAGLCFGAVGTDAGGSIRQPAAYCGVAGLKPTHGLVSAEGVLPMTYSLGSPGPIARTAADAALLLQAIADPRPAGRTGVAGARVGWLRDWHDQPAQCEAMTTAVQRLESAGATVEEACLPLAELDACGRVILLAEAYSVHAATLRARPEAYGRIGRHRFLLGAFLSAADLLRAQRLRARLARCVEATFDRFDWLLTAGEAGPAPRFEDAQDSFPFVQQPSLRMPFNVSGHPAVCVPCGSVAGMPLGAQVIGRWWDDLGVLGAAAAVEVRLI